MREKTIVVYTGCTVHGLFNHLLVACIVNVKSHSISHRLVENVTKQSVVQINI